MQTSSKDKEVRSTWQQKTSRCSSCRQKCWAQDAKSTLLMRRTSRATRSSADDSRAGRGSRVADGKVIPSKGEATLQFEVDGEEGQVHEMLSSFQLAKVSKPLRSVSLICDAGFDILLTKTEAFVKAPASGRVVCTYPRSGGMCTGEMRRKNPPHPSFR